MKRMINKNIIITSVLLLVFSGCATSDFNLGSMGSFGKQEVQKPILEDNILLMPDEASNVILAVSAKILHTGKQSPDVSFGSMGNIPLLKDHRLFSFKNAVLSKYQKGHSLEADVYFVDSIGRTCGYKMNVEYMNRDGKIDITSYNVVEQYSPVENAVCFIFPAEEYKKLTTQMLPKSFYKLYNYAAARAVTPKEALKYTQKQEWVVMVFFMDRMSTFANMELGISDKTDVKERGFRKKTRYFEYEGWKVGVIMGKFHLMQPNSDKPLYAKAFYIPGSESGDFFLFRKEKLVGMYKLR